MNEPRRRRQSLRAEALAVFLSASVGCGIGWVLWIVTGNIAVAIGVAGPMAALASSLARRVLS